MFIEILSRTPLWVFFLFFVLLILGYVQSKNRTLSYGKVSTLPMAMIVLSFYGVISAFGVAPIGLAFWMVGVAIAVGFSIKHAAPKGVTFSARTRLFSIPGSWLPLALMMAIFFIKYMVGVVLARQLPMANEATFIGSIGFCYGFFSGIFLARAIFIFRCAT